MQEIENFGEQLAKDIIFSGFGLFLSFFFQNNSEAEILPGSQPAGVRRALQENKALSEMLNEFFASVFAAEEL